MIEVSLRLINSSGAPITGLTGANIKFRRSPYGSGDEIAGLTVSEVGGQGNYLIFGFPNYEQARLFIDGVQQNWWGTKWVGNADLRFVNTAGDTMTGALNLGGNRLENVGNPNSGDDAGSVDYNDARYVDKTTDQTVGGKKTFSNIVIDVGNSGVSSAKLVVQSASNPPNGGVIGLKAGYQASNKMLFDFQNSEVKIPDPASAAHAASKQYVDNNFVDKTTNQGVGGQKTFSDVIIDVGTSAIGSPKFRIRQASNPPNGGVTGLSAGYQASNKMLFDFQNSEVKIPDPASAAHAASKQYVDNNFVDKTTNQGVGGQKTFSDVIIDVGTSAIGSPKFRIRQASNPANGGVTGLSAGYRSTNKMLFDFNSGANASEVNVEDLKIKTSAGKFIAGNPAVNDYVWKKWVQDNFQAIESSYLTHTIIIDQLVTVNVLLKAYSTPQAALVDLESVPSAINRYTLLFKQPAFTNEYIGDIELPDWVNLVGECAINISGKIFRTASAETGITSVVQNLTFAMDDSHDLQRLESIGCIFSGTSVDIERSKFRNCGFYGNLVQSSNDNKIVNCFGNYDIAWQDSDRVYSYNFIEGDNW